MRNELDESPALVEFSLLLEVRFIGDFIRGPFEDAKVGLITFVDVWQVAALLAVCGRGLILIFCALLVLACPYFFAEEVCESMFEIGDSSPEALPEEDWNVDCDHRCC